jgi:hypothetical protein
MDSLDHYHLISCLLELQEVKEMGQRVQTNGPREVIPILRDGGRTRFFRQQESSVGERESVTGLEKSHYIATTGKQPFGLKNNHTLRSRRKQTGGILEIVLSECMYVTNVVQKTLYHRWYATRRQMNPEAQY